MQPLPSIAPFADLLADLAGDLRRGNCCLVTADKGWTHFLFRHLRDRLRANKLRFEYIDGRPLPNDNRPDEVGVMLTAITQLRRTVRGAVEGVVIVLPHLDVMATSEGGWTTISRELVPLLYECPEVVLLGFRDPTLPLLPVVEKLFPKRYFVEQPFAGAASTSNAVPPSEPDSDSSQTALAIPADEPPRSAGEDVRAVTLRPYRPDDAPALLALFRDTIRRVNARDYNPEQIAAWASDDIDLTAWADRFTGRFAVVAENAAQPVGFAELEADGHIDRFYVSADHQGQGVGGALLEAIVTEARRLGLTRLFVEASITARPFFEAQEFTVLAQQVVTCRGVEFVNYRMERGLS